MKILLVSDTHGNTDGIIKFIKNEYSFDLLIHLGDYVEDGEKIGKALDIPSYIVKGNGDIFSQGYKYEEIIEIEKKRFFLTHGHKYGVNFGLTNLYYRGEELGADYILFGHSHLALIERVGSMTIMNPGSPVQPRDYARNKTFGLIELGQKGGEKIIKIK